MLARLANVTGVPKAKSSFKRKVMLPVVAGSATPSVIPLVRGIRLVVWVPSPTCSMPALTVVAPL